MKSSLQIITILANEHKLEGIEMFEYIYDRAEKTLVINADGVEIRAYQGRKATAIYTSMSE